jgi:hypothetical protein
MAERAVCKQLRIDGGHHERRMRRTPSLAVAVLPALICVIGAGNVAALDARGENASSSFGRLGRASIRASSADVFRPDGVLSTCYRQGNGVRAARRAAPAGGL